jgi:hypothetical protein
VPEQHYEAMLERLLALTTGRTERPSTAAESVPELHAEAAVQTLNQRFEAAWEDLRTDQHVFFALLAERPGERVPFQPDVSTALGGPRQAQNALISLTPRLRRNSIDPWPIEVRRDERGGLTYMIDEGLARLVLRLSESSS